ncbi:MAG: ribulokinase [Sphingobacteriia bacterium]|nr:MAG: ribulokinase [Sphingobacteriia bacterium]
MNDNYVIGIDYGTDSVRAIIVNAANGTEISSATFYYPRWKDGLYCNPSIQQYRQHPLDYIEGLEFTIKACIEKAGNSIAAKIKAIAVDTTGSTPIAVDETGTPLALLPAFEHNPHAMFLLWKDHTAIKEAAEINKHATLFPTNYLQFVGGIYSSEWFWAKLLKTLRTDEKVRAACYGWVEHCDWIPFLLTGATHINQMKVGVCAAGHKALWNESFGGLPPNHFFSKLDPLLDGFRNRLFQTTYTSDQAAGFLSAEWATRLGLSTNVVVGVGAFDAHMGAVGGQIEPYHLSKVMGTSTCDILVAPGADINNRCIKGICGQVNGSVIPGMIGLEAGQSAFGDAYGWFKNVLSFPLQNTVCPPFINEQQAADYRDFLLQSILPTLDNAAAKIDCTIDAALCIDWMNGRRTPDANQALKGVFSGLDLGTTAVDMYRALVEATCFGAKAIVNRFVDEGIPVKGLIGLGGVAKKSPFIMQMMADILNMPIRIHKSDQTCAAGAAMFAATVAGIYPTVQHAMKAMGQGFEITFSPNSAKYSIYEKRFAKYKALGNFTESFILND